MSHVFGPINGTFSLPWFTNFTRGLKNLEICLQLYRLLYFWVKISFIAGDDMFPLSRNISIAID